MHTCIHTSKNQRKLAVILRAGKMGGTQRRVARRGWREEGGESCVILFQLKIKFYNKKNLLFFY